MADQIDNLILKTETSEQNLKRLTAELAKVENSIEALGSTFQAGAIGFDEFETKLDVLSGRAQTFRGAIASLGTGTAQTVESTGRLNQAFQTLSFTTNDATMFFVSARAGVNAIANNIPGVVNALSTLATAGFGGVLTALSGPAGLILGLTAAAALVPVLTAHWGDLEDAFGLGGTRTEAEEMERLGKATKLSADEAQRLANYKDRERVGKALADARPEAVKKAEEAATKVLGEFAVPGGASGLDRIAGSLAQARNPGGVPLDQAGKDRLAAIEASGTSFRGPEVAARELADARREEQARVEKDAGDRAKQDIEDYLRGALPGGIGGLVKEIEATPGAFPAGLAGKLRASAPEAVERKKQTDELNKQGIENEYAGQEALLADREKSLAERKRQTDELNKQGEENEYAAQEDRLKGEKDAKKANDELNKQGEENEVAGKEEAVKQAKEFGDDVLAKAGARGGNSAAAISRYLQQVSGLDKGTADALARDAAVANRKDRVEGLLIQKPRSSEVFGGASLTDKIQQAVGGEGDVNQKQLKEAQRTNEILNRLAQPGHRGSITLRPT
jgi:hypothetical protein